MKNVVLKKRGILKFNKDKIDSDNLILMDIKPTNLKNSMTDIFSIITAYT